MPKIYKRIILKNKKDHTRQKNIFKKYIKTNALDNIISVDETSIDTYISSDYGWSVKGKIITNIKKKQRIRYTVISAITNNKIIYNKCMKGSANAIDFKKFLISVINKTGHNYVILLDNALR